MTSRTFFVISGIVLIVGGVLALLMPYVASLTATLIVGWAFLIVGGIHVVGAVRDAENRLWNGIFGLLELLLGASFIFNPMSGMISLTIVLGGLFLASGLMQLYLAWRMSGRDSVWMLAVSGVVSVALAALIAFNLLEASASVPGILLGIELISTGVAFLMLRPKQIRDIRVQMEDTSQA